MNAQKPTITSLKIGGHEIRMSIDPSEKEEMESISSDLSTRLAELTSKMTTGSQAKVATMVAFEYACQLNEANAMLEEAEKLHAEVEKQKLAIQKLECLLEKVDHALLA